MSNISKTNWARVDALTDEQIDTSDVPPLEEDFFQRATLRQPSPYGMVAVEIDAETLSWYEAQGEQARERMSAALRIYAHAHQTQRKSA